MGFVALCAGIVAALVALGPGILTAIVHHRARREGRGSWPIYLGLTAFGILMCIAIAVLFIHAAGGEGGGAPTGEQYEALVISAAICLAGPGIGMTLGAFALLKRD